MTQHTTDVERMKLPRDFREPMRIFQIWVTRACDQACFGCTQGSNLAGKPGLITPEQFECACQSMVDYPGIVAMFGGNPCMHPQFETLCEIHRKYIVFSRRGIWTNSLLGHGDVCRRTFNPRCSNFNLHLNREAAEEFARDWPEAVPYIKGVEQDSRHSPPYVAIKDVVADEQEMWRIIATCDINRYWSAMIGVFRGQLRGWFCEIAGAQSMLHQHEPDYPDTGCAIEPGWWKQGYEVFGPQILRHCPDCGVPLRGAGSLGVGGTTEQVSATHAAIYRPKRRGRPVELVTDIHMLGKRVRCATDYMQHGAARRKRQ